MSWVDAKHALNLLQMELLEKMSPINLDDDSSVSSQERRSQTISSLRELFYRLTESRNQNEVLFIEYGDRNRMACLPQDFGIGYHMSFIVEKMYVNMLTKTHSTRRSIYYERPEIFKSQSAVDAAVDRVCHILNLPQWRLGVLSTSKGLVYGPLIILLDSGIDIDCTQQTGGTLIPQDLPNGAVLETDAAFVLVIEKDTVFQKLLRSQLGQPQSQCILVTGKGYPDMGTRLLVRKLAIDLVLPTFAIVDGDPHGIEIFFNYKYGSLKRQHLNSYLAAPNVFWLGVHPTDMINIPDDQLIPQCASDVSKIEQLLQRKCVREYESLQYQLMKLLDSKKKCEVEALYMLSPNYLSDTYIPSKIANGFYI